MPPDTLSNFYSVNRKEIPAGRHVILAILVMAPDEQFEAEEREGPQVARHGCPKCGSMDVRRARSEGFKAGLLQMFGRWPFRCRSCRVKFFRSAPPPEDY